MTTATKMTRLSGLYYPNRMARLMLTALEEVMGTNGVNALLNMKGLNHLIGNFPSENLEKQFDFAHFTGVLEALEDMYGPRGGRGLALRAGRACLTRGLKNFGALAGVGDLAFKVLPLPAKLKIGLPALATLFTNFSDQRTTVQEFGEFYVYTIHQCPCCWERKTDRPCCHMAAGVITEGLRWVSGGLEFRVQETKCIAMGDPACDFTIWKAPINA